MKRFMALMSASAISLGSLAAHANTIDSLIVQVSPAAEEANVEDIHPNLEPDLQAVMEQKFLAHRADDGVDVSVRIIEVSLDGSQILTEDDEFNHLEGWVYMRPDGDPGNVTPVKVIIDAKTGALFKDAEGMIVIPDKELFYNAMLNGFAEKALETVMKYDG